MNLFKLRATKANMLEALVKTRTAIEALPATKDVIEMHDILTRFEASFENGKEPSEAEVEVWLNQMIPIMGRL